MDAQKLKALIPHIAWHGANVLNIGGSETVIKTPIDGVETQIIKVSENAGETQDDPGGGGVLRLAASPS